MPESVADAPYFHRFKHALSGGTGNGGGIYNDRSLSVTNSTLSGNSAGSDGGGIYERRRPAVTNSTLSGNTAGRSRRRDRGGGTVTSSTLTGNSAPLGGGVQGGGVLTNTIVAGNTSTAGVPDLYGGIGTGGHNLFGTTTGALITLGPGDLVNPAPLLGTLGSNGGPTPTIPLLPGSPAIAHGDPAVCAQSGADKVNGVDQRGFPRQVSICSIGAFEAQPAVPNPLPPPKPPGPVGGPPNPLPVVRPPGLAVGTVPNPLPPPRP